MSDYVKAAKLEDIPEGDGLMVQIGRREVALFRVEGEVHAIDNVCPHRGGPLAEGMLDGRVLTCPWHAWTFDVSTGKCTFHDGARVEKFPVKVQDGHVEVLVPERIKTDEGVR